MFVMKYYHATVYIDIDVYLYMCACVCVTFLFQLWLYTLLNVIVIHHGNGEIVSK